MEWINYIQMHVDEAFPPSKHIGLVSGVVFPFIGGEKKKQTILFFFAQPEGDQGVKYDRGENLLVFINHLLKYASDAIRRVYSEKLDGNKHVLTKREAQIMEWAVKGKTAWEIATILSISERTVKFHFSNIYQKLNVTNRQQAVATL